MECNRDEALRAKQIAERMFLAKDIKGAKKFALKAKNLYPEVEGVSQMLKTFEVYIAAEEGKVREELDWYGALGVTRLADDATIKKQYRKLALLLHPDKNPSVGAEGAFSLVSQAWNMLSDRSKRIAYDQRCDSAFQQANNVGTSKPPKQNGFCNASKASRVKIPKGNSGKRDGASFVPPPVSKKLPETFWTACHQCKMQYEYLRVYLNRNLLCPNCQEAYLATEIEAPSTKIHKTTQTSNSLKRKNSGQQGSSSHNHQSSDNNNNNNNSQWAPFSGSTGAASAVHAANLVRQAFDEVKRQRKKVQADKIKDDSSKRTDAENSNAAKRRKVVAGFGTQVETVTGVNFECGEIHMEKHFDLKQDCLGVCKTKNDDSVCDVHLKQFLMENARCEVRKNLKKNFSDAMMDNMTAEKVDKNIKGPKTCNQDTEHRQDRKQVEQMVVDVLDSDFHDFDKERTAMCFRENQVWAVYDDDDGMPRHYTMIDEVMSLNPFKLKMRWLNPTTTSRSGHISWFAGGFSKTCGQFRKGGVVSFDSVISFSHVVRWRECHSKTIQICPMKGDVWALYRNWSAEWNELTEDDVLFKYEIVEVLEDYDEDLGVLVVSLSKVSGFKAVFRKHFDPKEIRRIPKKEMSRFSHQVPSHLLSGKEGSKHLKDCRELDPAATSVELLEAISQTEEIEFMEIDESVEFVKSVDCENVNAGDRDCKATDISITGKGILESQVNEVIFIDN